MTKVFLEQDGRAIDVSGPGSLAKAIGWGPTLHKPIHMVDESGQLIGAGYTVDAVNRSQPLIKSLNDQVQRERMMKADSLAANNKRTLHKKKYTPVTLIKALSDLEELRRERDRRFA
jgi:hypothetical protein